MTADVRSVRPAKPGARASRKAALGVAWLIVAAAATGAPARSRADADSALRVQALIAGLDCDQARAELATLDPDDPRVAVELARLAVYELDCDGAMVTLGRPEVERADEGGQLAEIARACQRATASIAVDRDRARGIEIHWQDEHDRALGPQLFDVVAQARAALTRDLGVDWPNPTRIVVVRDLVSLSAMTGLPYESARTTGTLAVAKWGRITLLSPRASRHGYPWLDTIAHELTHLAVTRATRDRAPLWLQEGIAKREETRWRTPGPFDDRPPPDAVVAEGERLKLDLPLDKLGPSIAMLPSAEAATVAYAEVTSFVRFYTDTQGDQALPRLLAEFRQGKGTDESLVAASRSDLKGWDARWRAFVNARPQDPLPSLLGLGSGHDDAAKRADWSEVRDRSRLADLLLARDHHAEALIELDRMHAATEALVAGDGSLRWMRARALEATGKRGDGASLVAEAKDLVAPYAPWWALRGRWARLDKNETRAEESFREALANDPLEPEAACESIDALAAPSTSMSQATSSTPAAPAMPADPEKAPLCDAARAASGPTFGED